MTRDQGAATGQMPYEPGRCECGELEPIHKLSETTGERMACSSSTCDCRRYVSAQEVTSRG